jgi:hypothetical protein
MIQLNQMIHNRKHNIPPLDTNVNFIQVPTVRNSNLFLEIITVYAVGRANCNSHNRPVTTHNYQPVDSKHATAQRDTGDNQIKSTILSFLPVNNQKLRRD